MPMYEYECPSCGAFEIRQKMSDPPLAVHDVCGSPVERRISMTSFALRGSGWYADGYNGGSKVETKSETKGETKGESCASASSCENKSCPAKADAPS